MKKQFILLTFLFYVIPVVSQQSLDQLVDLQIANQTISEALYQLIDEQGIKLSFRNEILPTDLITIKLIQIPLHTALDQLLKNADLSYRLVGKQILIYFKPKPVPKVNYTISGFVSDFSTGEHLIGANIVDQQSHRGTVSNEYGFFSLTLPAGSIQIGISYLGYQIWDKKIELQSSLQIEAELNSSITLQEVVVYAQDNLGNPIGGLATGIQIGLRETQLLTSLAGEPDIVRTALLSPGVTSGAGGAEGLQVRGSGAGQNLVLLDGVPVYYVNHAIGLFSTFNSSAIRSAQLLRGGFPARYGGRLSSVLDVRMKEGNDQKSEVSTELGLLAARFSMEGPIIRGQSSYFLSGRWSFVHGFLRPLSQKFKREDNKDGITDYRFNDFNLKINHRFSNKDRIFLSLFRGQDAYEDLTISHIEFAPGAIFHDVLDKHHEEGINWNNTVGALRWNHVFNDQLFANFRLSYSELDLSSSFKQLDIETELNFETIDTFVNRGLYQSGIKDIGLQADWHFFPKPQQEYRFGIGVNQRTFRPVALISENTLEDLPFNNNRIFSNELSTYVENLGAWKNKWRYNIGMHLSSWFVRGKGYVSIQPRLSMEYLVKSQSFVKFSISRMVQYLHLLNNTAAGLPTEIWVPSTEKIGPAKALIGSIGYKINFRDKYRFEIESYYKKMNNLLTFNEGQETFKNWETNVSQGQGESYGTELMFSKNQEKLTGWVSYTLSRSVRQYKAINLGRVYPFKYDRPHNVKVALIYRLRPNIYFSSNWTYSSGFAFTLPLIKFTIGQPGSFIPSDLNPEVSTADAKNNFRMPAYHQLDANFHFEWSSQNNVLKHQLNLGIYNAYNRNNPLYYDVRLIEKSDPIFGLVQNYSFVEVQLTPILPSLSYQLKF